MKLKTALAEDAYCDEEFRMSHMHISCRWDIREMMSIL